MWRCGGCGAVGDLVQHVAQGTSGLCRCSPFTVQP